MRLSDLTPQWLLKNFFFGIYKKDPDTGDLYLAHPTDPTQRLEESVIQNSIDSAISWIEDSIGARIRKIEQLDEHHDYDRDYFGQYVYIPLDYYPVYEVSSVEFTYGENGSTIWTVPLSIVQLHSEKFGTIQLLPYTSLLYGSAYDPALVPFVPGAFSSNMLPSTLKVNYSSGMDGLDAELDPLIVRAIALLACNEPFNIMGDIIISAGIATISTSFDGISQSVGTTASAENHAFSARMIQHNHELYGYRAGVSGLLDTLKTKWRRMPLAMFG